MHSINAIHMQDSDILVQPLQSSATETHDGERGWYRDRDVITQRPDSVRISNPAYVSLILDIDGMLCYGDFRNTESLTCWRQRPSTTKSDSRWPIMTTPPESQAGGECCPKDTRETKAVSHVDCRTCAVRSHLLLYLVDDRLKVQTNVCKLSLCERMEITCDYSNRFPPTK
jgi:hypothetical protein